MAMRIIPDPSEEERGCYRLFAEMDGERLDATISEVALLELGCEVDADLGAFVAGHETMLEDLFRAVRAKRPASPLRVWVDDVRRRETTAAGGLGGPPSALK